MIDWDLYGWVKRSKQRQKIVDQLGRPKTPTDIAEALDADLSQISYSLSQFKERGLVEVMNPDARQGRIYRLTEEGEAIREEINEKE